MNTTGDIKRLDEFMNISKNIGRDEKQIQKQHIPAAILLLDPVPLHYTPGLHILPLSELQMIHS